MTAPVATPGREHWVERIPHREAVMLEDVDLFADFFVACEREDGLPRLRMWRFEGDGPEAAPAGEIAFPEPAYSAHPHANRIFETTTYRYAYQSLVTPSSVYEYDTASGTSTLLKQVEIPGGFDRTNSINSICLICRFFGCLTIAGTAVAEFNFAHSNFVFMLGILIFGIISAVGQFALARNSYPIRSISGQHAVHV